jgi:hypothetical protein
MSWVTASPNYPQHTDRPLTVEYLWETQWLTNDNKDVMIDGDDNKSLPLAFLST